MVVQTNSETKVLRNMILEISVENELRSQESIDQPRFKSLLWEVHWPLDVLRRKSTLESRGKSKYQSLIETAFLVTQIPENDVHHERGRRARKNECLVFRTGRVWTENLLFNVLKVPALRSQLIQTALLDASLSVRDIGVPRAPEWQTLNSWNQEISFLLNLPVRIAILDSISHSRTGSWHFSSLWIHATFQTEPRHTDLSGLTKVKKNSCCISSKSGSLWEIRNSKRDLEFCRRQFSKNDGLGLAHSVSGILRSQIVRKVVGLQEQLRLQIAREDLKDSSRLLKWTIR
jgi:hypothetical protein